MSREPLRRRELVRLSRFLSLVLRHRPERIGIELDARGWADVDTLLERACAGGVWLDRRTLDEIVETNDKRRFALSADGRRIRASQGHSVAVELGLPPATPPGRLFHGTADAALAVILVEGLRRRRRRHVHLSPDPDTARRVGRRHGRPVVLEIAARRMHDEGAVFFLSDNGVWLTDEVPPGFIRVPEGG